jgi:hypothetical protein
VERRPPLYPVRAPNGYHRRLGPTIDDHHHHHTYISYAATRGHLAVVVRDSRGLEPTLYVFPRTPPADYEPVPHQLPLLAAVVLPFGDRFLCYAPGVGIDKILVVDPNVRGTGPVPAAFVDDRDYPVRVTPDVVTTCGDRIHITTWPRSEVVVATERPQPSSSTDAGTSTRSTNEAVTFVCRRSMFSHGQVLGEGGIVWKNRNFGVIPAYAWPDSIDGPAIPDKVESAVDNIWQHGVRPIFDGVAAVAFIGTERSVIESKEYENAEVVDWLVRSPDGRIRTVMTHGIKWCILVLGIHARRRLAGVVCLTTRTPPFARVLHVVDVDTGSVLRSRAIDTTRTMQYCDGGHLYAGVWPVDSMLRP